MCSAEGRALARVMRWVGVLLSLAVIELARCPQVWAAPESPSSKGRKQAQRPPRGGVPASRSPAQRSVRSTTTRPVSFGSGATSRSATSSSVDALAKGVRLVRDSEWEQALRFFQAKKRQLVALRREDRVRLFVFLGVVRAGLLQRVRSRGAFEKALLLDPCATLPVLPSIAPQVRARFRTTRRFFRRACLRQRKSQQRVAPPLRRAPTPREPASRPLPEVAFLNPYPRPSKAIGVSAWIVTGVGGAGMAVALTFGGLAMLDDAARHRAPYTVQGTQDYLRLGLQAQERAFTANVLFGVSGALLFTGFALHIAKWMRSAPWSGPVVKPRVKPMRLPQPAQERLYHVAH